MAAGRSARAPWRRRDPAGSRTVRAPPPRPADRWSAGSRTRGSARMRPDGTAASSLASRASATASAAGRAWVAGVTTDRIETSIPAASIASIRPGPMSSQPGLVIAHGVERDAVVPRPRGQAVERGPDAGAVPVLFDRDDLHVDVLQVSPARAAGATRRRSGPGSPGTAVRPSRPGPRSCRPRRGCCRRSVNGAPEPPSSVCTQPGAMSSSVCGSPGVARGEAAHQLVQRGLARPVDLEAAPGVVGDAALARGHHPDSAVRDDEILQRLDDPHRAQRVGHHEPDEGIRRHVGHRLLRAVGHPGVDEQQVERRLGQPAVQRGDVLRNRDVDGLHDQAARRGTGQVGQPGTPRAPHRGRHLPAPLQVLGGQRVAQPT